MENVMSNVDSAKNQHQPEKNANSSHATDNSAKLQAQIKAKWSKLSEEDLKLVSVNRDQFIGKLKEKQGLSKEEAEKSLAEIEKSCGCGPNSAKNS